MMKIAICDDCIEDIKTLEKMILRNTEFDQKAEFGEFLNGETMLDRYEAYDVIFLDILMKGKKRRNGNCRKDTQQRRGRPSGVLYGI